LLIYYLFYSIYFCISISQIHLLNTIIRPHIIADVLRGTGHDLATTTILLVACNENNYLSRYVHISTVNHSTSSPEYVNETK